MFSPSRVPILATLAGAPASSGRALSERQAGLARRDPESQALRRVSQSVPSPEQPIRPAATVIVLRDGAAGMEVLLMQRASELSFHGGAWAFPGGRVDAADRVEGSPLDTARRAAVREAREEAQLELAPAELLPLAHWTTPPGGARRFATWFFVVRCADGACVVPDGQEMRAHRWLTPSAALAEQAEGRIDLPAPTFVSLTTLATFAAAEAVLAALHGAQPFVYVPRPRPVPEGVVSLYGGDAAYDDGALERAGARHRLCMFRSGWRYERSF
jgi:8-oxo-dGTP pyrophosphatase MutT (NUDIX family)